MSGVSVWVLRNARTVERAFRPALASLLNNSGGFSPTDRGRRCRRVETRLTSRKVSLGRGAEAPLYPCYRTSGALAARLGHSESGPYQSAFIPAATGLTSARMPPVSAWARASKRCSTSRTMPASEVTARAALYAAFAAGICARSPHKASPQRESPLSRVPRSYRHSRRSIGWPR